MCLCLLEESTFSKSPQDRGPKVPYCLPIVLTRVNGEGQTSDLDMTSTPLFIPTATIVKIHNVCVRVRVMIKVITDRQLGLRWTAMLLYFIGPGEESPVL